MYIPTTTLSQEGTLVLVFDSTLVASAASFDISGIPASYKHLRVIVSGRSDRAGAALDFMGLRLNNDSAGNYDYQQVGSADVAGIFSETYAASSFYYGDLPGATSPAGTSGSAEILIPDYLGTTFNKALISQNGSHHSATQMVVQTLYGRWASTAAVNRITLFSTTSSNYIAGSRVTVYGLN